MGVDIDGWIEVRDKPLDDFFSEITWFGVIQVGVLLHRNTNAFGCLFGVRNPSGFVPIAAHRGLPPDASDRVRGEIKEPDEYHSHTWVTWSELQQVDWDESVINAFINTYRKGEDGAWINDGGYIPREPIEYIEGKAWEEKGRLHKIERLTRAEAIQKGAFGLVFDLMKRLSEDFGDDYVRLVVWFDS